MNLQYRNVAFLNLRPSGEDNGRQCPFPSLPIA
jgi:hypothetical protein